MKFNYKLFFLITASILISILFMSYQNITDYLRYKVFFKNNLFISLSTANPQVKALTCDSDNLLILIAVVRDSEGNPCPYVPVRVTLSPNLGKIFAQKIRSDEDGKAIIKYIPPQSLIGLSSKNTTVRISAQIYDSSVSSKVQLSLKKPPVIMVHGYQEHGDIFVSMKDFLSSKGFDCIPIDYKSEAGVISGTAELETFLQKQKVNFWAKGIQVNKFDIIAHSMGGLVTRYYTCGVNYINKNDINKIIFVSVPHKGSYWATLGTNLYNNQGIKDLSPDNPLLSKVLPAMLNKGLNKSIQTGSILGQYDEVVTGESASLEEWNIKTEVFNVGENNLTIDNLLNGNILEASNHKNILFNNKVFEKIEEMLNENLPFPADKTE